MQIRNTNQGHYIRANNNNTDTSHSQCYSNEYFHLPDDNIYPTHQPYLQLADQSDSNFVWDSNRMASEMQSQVPDGKAHFNFQTQKSLPEHGEHKDQFSFTERNIASLNAPVAPIQSHDYHLLYTSSHVKNRQPALASDGYIEPEIQSQELQPRLERRVYSYTRKKNTVKRVKNRSVKKEKSFKGSSVKHSPSPLIHLGYYPLETHHCISQAIPQQKDLSSYNEDSNVPTSPHGNNISSELEFYRTPQTPHLWSQHGESMRQPFVPFAEGVTSINNNNPYCPTKFYQPIETHNQTLVSQNISHVSPANMRSSHFGEDKFVPYSSSIPSNQYDNSTNLSVQPEQLVFCRQSHSKQLNILPVQFQNMCCDNNQAQLAKPSKDSSHNDYYIKSGHMYQNEHQIPPNLLTPTSQCGSPQEKNADLNRRNNPCDSDTNTNSDECNQNNTNNLGEYSKDIIGKVENMLDSPLISQHSKGDGFSFREVGMTSQTDVDRFIDIADMHIEVFCRTICCQFNNTRKKKTKIGPDFVLNYMHHIDLDTIVGCTNDISSADK